MMQTPAITDSHHVELVITPWWMLGLAALAAFAIAYFIARRRDR